MFTGGFEFVFLLFIAFLLFGPKKLPEIARVLGKGLGELRKASNDLKTSLEDEIRNLERETDSQRRAEAALPPPAYTREHRETSQEPQGVLESGLRPIEATSTAELTETVHQNGHNHRETADGESSS